MPLDIDPQKVPVVLLYNLDPSWTSQEKEEATLLSSQLGQAVSQVGHPVAMVPVSDSDLSAALRPFDPSSHIVFNWCENLPATPRSESLVAQILESLGFVFTGAGGRALTLAQDKRAMKEILSKAGIPTPTWRLYDRPQADGWNRFPAIVKAANEHSSEGLTRESVVMNEEELSARVAYVLKTYDQPALVEDFIDGREFHVSLWGNGTIDMLPPAEMDFSQFKNVHDRLCTYDAKFVPGSESYEGIKTLLPALLGADDLRTLKRVCQAAYRAIGCRDYGRIDLRIRDGVFYVLDVNPNADISADASLACAAELAVYSYGEMGSRIVRLAANRHPGWGRGSGDIGSGLPAIEGWESWEKSSTHPRLKSSGKRGRPGGP
ncbi:MAG: ATP-grasp domain-containing protein [Pseudomonadota bacterium]